jgi:hypothetical protein
MNGSSTPMRRAKPSDVLARCHQGRLQAPAPVPRSGYSGLSIQVLLERLTTPGQPRAGQGFGSTARVLAHLRELGPGEDGEFPLA